MSIARPFAYNPGTTIPGTEQLGNLSIGIPTSGFTDNPQYWNGPDEDLGYVIAKPISGNTQPTPLIIITASVGFGRSPLKTEESFVEYTNSIFGQSFTTGSQAKEWLNNNGYWTSYDLINPTATPTGTPSGTPTSTPTPTETPTQTPTGTPGETTTPTPSETPTQTPTTTTTLTSTSTPTSTSTSTPTSTETPTTTPTLTSTPTQTQTSTQTPTTTTTLTATQTQTNTQTPTPIGCTSYTVSTTSATGQSFTYTDCDGTETGGNIGGASGFDAETFCARTGTVNLIGVELTLTINGVCFLPTPTATPIQTSTQTPTPTQTPTIPSECTSYTVSTTSATGQSFTYTDCDGTETGGNIGGSSGYEAETFCARTGTVNLIGVELTLTINGVCFLPTPTQTPSHTPSPTPTTSTLNIDVQTNASLDITLTKITVNGVIATVAGGVWPNTSGNGASLFVNLPEGTYDVIIDYNASTPGQHIEISSPITGPACQNTGSSGLSSLTFTSVGMSSTTPLSVLAADGTC